MLKMNYFSVKKKGLFDEFSKSSFCKTVYTTHEYIGLHFKIIQS